LTTGKIIGLMLGSFAMFRHDRDTGYNRRMHLSRAQFVECLTSSGILAADDLAAFENKVPAAKSASSAQAYARLLVQHGKLSNDQVAAVAVVNWARPAQGNRDG
jgi:hypothetical protein